MPRPFSRASLKFPQACLLVVFTILLFYIAAHSSAPFRQQSTPAPPAGPDGDGKYTLTSASGLRAQFVPYGASLSNLFISDAHGIERDVVMGLDTADEYRTAVKNDHLGGIVGRYANRIKNASFEMDGTTYHLDDNENGNTLHGGRDSWDSQEWTVEEATEREIVFSFRDESRNPGFPGDVDATVKYSLHPTEPEWVIDLAARVAKKTPLMLTSHVYWNLDGFANADDPTVYKHTLDMPDAGRRIAVDDELIPTGKLLPNERGGPFDFWSHSPAKEIGKDIDLAKGGCGKNCNGYDTCFTIDDHDEANTWVAKLSSNWSGISVAVYSDQPAFQVYSCSGESGQRRLKRTQGSGTVSKGGCLVMEIQDWIDRVNHPEWNGRRFWEPSHGEYRVQMRYKFDVAHIGRQ